ncbi:MAG: hypothetical protein B7Y51_03185 [Burkholderiales bacterium 28-67-8]|nr:MAG: hypothetical protein B7Y51_03185 [Burkholderiales bacterium 28-67-8]
MTTHLRRPAPSTPLFSASFLAVLAAFTTPTAAAQDAATQLETVVVTASRSDTRLQDMPLHTTVLTQEDIRRSPAQTLDQLLRNVSGLLVPGSPAYTTDPTGHNIKFRGMDKKVLVLVDGVPALDPFYTTIQWFKVPLSAIERIEIVRGGGSSLWGNLAVGGVINVITRRPTSNSGEASMSIGSHGTKTVALSKNFVLSDALSLSLSADRFETDGYNNTPGRLRAAYWPGRGKSSATADNFRLGVNYQPLPDLGGFLRVGYHQQNERIGGYAFGENQQRSPDVQLGVTKRIDASSSVMATAYMQHVNFDKYNGAGCYAAATYACGASVSGAGASTAQQAGATLQYASSHDLLTYRERGGSVVYSSRWQSLLKELQVGLDYRYISGEDAQQSFRTPTAARPEALRVQRTNDGAGAQEFTGVFSQFKLRPLEPLEFTLGLRVDHFSSFAGRAVQTNYSNVANPVAAAPTGGAVPNSHKTAFDPSLSARYELTDDIDIRGSIYKAFRAPGLNNLYRSFGSSSISIANPLLAPETMVGKEIGLDWKLGSSAFGITVFEAEVKDMVATYGITSSTPVPDAVKNICGSGYAGVSNSACPGTVSFYSNGQDQKAWGVEIDGKWALSRDLSLSAYATRTQSHYTHTTTGDPVDTQLSLVPRLVTGASLAWRTTERWSQYADVRYNSSMTLSNLTAATPIRQGGYAVFNLGTTYRINERFEVAGALTNVFDKRYTDSSASNPQGISYAMPRAGRVSLHVHF